LIIFALIIKNPVYLGLLLIANVCFIIYQGNFNEIKRSIKGYIIIALTIAIINPLVSHKGSTILFYMFNNPLTLEACIYGIISGLALLNIFIIFISLNTIFSYQKLLYLFSKIAPTFTIIIIMTLRFIPLMRYRLREIIDIQKIREEKNNKKNIMQKIKDKVKILDTLIVVSLEDAMNTADSMSARGFGVAKRTSYIKYSYSLKDLLLSVMMFLSIILIIFGYLNDFSLYNIYPTVQKINIDIYNLIIFIVHVAFPFILSDERNYNYATN
jgi:energy-coupling factor transport system permease protein